MTQDAEPSPDLQEFNTLLARYKAQSWADVPRTFSVGLVLLGLTLFCTLLTITFKTSFFMDFILPALAISGIVLFAHGGWHLSKMQTAANKALHALIRRTEDTQLIGPLIRLWNDDVLDKEDWRNAFLRLLPNMTLQDAEQLDSLQWLSLSSILQDNMILRQLRR